MASAAFPAVEWLVSRQLVPYEAACALMAERVDAIAAGTAPELVWLLEHPPLYTAGTSAKAADLIEPGRFPVHRSGRGGQFTYHGPGQRVGYVMLDVGRRWGDVRAYVGALEQLIIEALASLGVEAHTRSGLVGVWVRRLEGDREREDEDRGHRRAPAALGELARLSASMWRRTWRTSPASCRAASAPTASRALPTSVRARGWRRSMPRCAALSSAASASTCEAVSRPATLAPA